MLRDRALRSIGVLVTHMSPKQVEYRQLSSARFLIDSRSSFWTASMMRVLDMTLISANSIGMAARTELLAKVHSSQDFIKAGIAFQLGQTRLDFEPHHAFFAHLDTFFQSRQRFFEAS